MVRMYVYYPQVKQTDTKRGDTMATSKRALWARTLATGLAQANRGSIFWTRADAMQTFHYFHKGV